ncbi:hypothetical protein [Mesobacillus harenae]|uniref:hypothetical protein n=1 Tax=Mesobacillus harenae TaxID=2213203 RepID=UPI001580545E|nr:hypothetical protein [Mesobacillus harenae]
MSVNFISSFIYILIVGFLFIYVFKIIYDFLYGENHEKQKKKLHKYFKDEQIKSIEIIEHHPRNRTLFLIKTNKYSKQMTLKPGYRIEKGNNKETKGSRWF